MLHLSANQTRYVASHIAGMKRILVVTGLALFFAHLVACFWFLFAKLNDFGPDTWVAKRGIANRSSSYLYLVAFYWSV